LFYNRVYNTFRASPYFLRKFLYLIPIKYRLGGKDFINMYSFLNESEKWSREKLREYQKTQLRHLLEHAVKHVPFYSNIKLTSLDPFKNLEKFPIVDKQTIQRNIDRFKADNISKKNTYNVTTGGTSGNPLGFYLDNSTYGKEWAFVMAGWKRVGFIPGDKVVSFRGVEFINAGKGVYWQDNPIYNTVEMSPFHMSEKNLSRYVEKIKRIKPKFLHGYPSAISLLASYVDKGTENFPPIKAVLAVSENIYPWQRKLIEKAFNTRLFSFYGMSEKVIMAPECEFDIRYHAFPEYGITEVIDKNGNLVEEGQQGELVGTGFLNYCMPFIRYRTGDYAIVSRQECKCMRNHFMLEELMGRCSQEMLMGKSGTLIPFNALYIAIHSDVFKNIYRFQFHQKQPGEVILKIITRRGFTDSDRKRIIDVIYRRAGDDLQLFVEEVEKIELTDRGKFKALIQELSIKFGDSRYESEKI